MVGVLSFLPLSRFDHGTTLVGATIGSPLQNNYVCRLFVRRQQKRLYVRITLYVSHYPRIANCNIFVILSFYRLYYFGICVIIE